MKTTRTPFIYFLIDYALYFFTNVPVRQWTEYPASVSRVWAMIKETEDIKARCADVFEWGTERKKIIERAKESLTRNGNSR